MMREAYRRPYLRVFSYLCKYLNVLTYNFPFIDVARQFDCTS